MKTRRNEGCPEEAGARGMAFHARGARQARAFTLIEILVVVVVVGILAALLLPALAKAKSAATGMACNNNVRQLAFAWLLYADDQDGRLVPNLEGPVGGWVSGTLDFERANTDNTNVNLLMLPRHAKLGPFAQDPKIFKCPSDQSQVASGSGKRARVRSMSMNAAVGTDAGDPQWASMNGSWRTYQQISQITAPSPSALWVFMDEHPDSVDDGRFTTDLSQRGESGYFYSWPGNFHGEGSNLSFADGHVERRRWLDGRTQHENKYCGCLSSYAKAGNFTRMSGSPDVVWLQERTSSRTR